MIRSNPKREQNATDYLNPFYFEKLAFSGTSIGNNRFHNFTKTENKYNLKIPQATKFFFRANDLITESELVINTGMSKLLFTTFFFLCLFLLSIWLIHIRKKYAYTDYLIFYFHNKQLLFTLLSNSFMINSVLS